MLSLSLSLALLAPQGPSAPVVINEFSYDDTGTDDREFVELYNCTNKTIDLSNWVLDSADQVGPNTAYTIPAGTMLAPGDYYVLGSANVPNVDQVVGATNLWENDQESLTLRDSLGNVIDTLVYEANKGLWVGALPEGEGIWGNFTSIDGQVTSWSRARDGIDSGNNGRDFVLAPSTPGTSNNFAFGAWSNNFDAAAVESAVNDWASSFVAPKVVDPTTVSASNPSAIPASPQGGNCAVYWDPTGGGNTNMLTRDITGPATLECWVYVDAVTLPGLSASEWLHWTIGFGTTGTFSNSPDPSGTLGAGFDANGNTGVAWTFQNTPSGAAMYLIDHNDGGWAPSAVTPPTILGSVAITQGQNDGWQRLYLRRDGTAITGVFGGTYGSGTSTGTVITGPDTWIGPTTCYVGYRENDGVPGIPAWVRPFALDDLTVSATPTGASITTFGTAVATNAGTPNISAIGLPTIGNLGFGLNLSGLVPNSTTWLFIGTPTSFPLSSIGGQPGSVLLVNALPPGFVAFVPTDGSGNATVSFWIPCLSALAGLSVSWQVIDPDGSLPFALPVGNSQRLDTNFGW